MDLNMSIISDVEPNCYYKSDGKPYQPRRRNKTPPLENIVLQIRVKLIVTMKY